MTESVRLFVLDAVDLPDGLPPRMPRKIKEIAEQWDADSGNFHLRSTVDSIHQKIFHMSVRYSIRSVNFAMRFLDDLKEYPLSFAPEKARWIGPCTDGVGGEDAYDKDVPLLVSLPTTLMYNQYLSDRSSDEKHIFELHYQAARVLTALDSVEYSPYSDWPEPSEEEKKWLDEWGEHVGYCCGKR